MAIEFIDSTNSLLIHVPNSEASVNAQHNGNKDTSVGSYYMSEQQPLVHDFLNEFEGDFYIDLTAVLYNSKKIIFDLKNRGLDNAFKKKLVPQDSAIQVLEWIISNDGPLYKMPNPSVNENNKYLKFNNLDNTVDTFRTLCLGELCDICIQKIGISGFVIYLKACEKYEEIVNEQAFKWVIQND